MASREALAYLRRGRDAWNVWRSLSTSDDHVDLSSTDLSGMDVTGYDFRQCDLRWVGLRRSNCEGCDFTNADLMGANLRQATLTGSVLRESDLRWVHLIEADLRGADLRGALLQGALLLKTDLRGADLRGARIFGISAWGVILDSTTNQSDLIITSLAEPLITADSIDVAQFLYLLLNNQKIRHVIDTLTTKAVLILGRFTPDRKVVLDAVRDELRRRDYLPIVFDFEEPSNVSTDETIATLAGLVRFIIADLTDAKSVLQELRNLVPNRPSLPVQPILLQEQDEPGMFDFFRRFHWMLETRYYANRDELLADISERVIRPAELKVAELRGSPATGQL
jgi:uncharacterized protein YjbI with pentapeptide repeats